MKSKLKCECCHESLNGDFSGNVSCVNDQCLLNGKCYSHDFIHGRLMAREAGSPMQTKERMAQGWASEFGIEKQTPDDPRDSDYSHLKVGMEVEFMGPDDEVISGLIDEVMTNNVKVGFYTPPKWFVKVVS